MLYSNTSVALLVSQLEYVIECSNHQWQAPFCPEHIRKLHFGRPSRIELLSAICRNDCYKKHYALLCSCYASDTSANDSAICSLLAVFSGNLSSFRTIFGFLTTFRTVSINLAKRFTFVTIYLCFLSSCCTTTNHYLYVQNK